MEGIWGRFDRCSLQLIAGEGRQVLPCARYPIGLIHPQLDSSPPKYSFSYSLTFCRSLGSDGRSALTLDFYCLSHHTLFSFTFNGLQFLVHSHRSRVVWSKSRKEGGESREFASTALDGMLANNATDG